MRIVGGSHRGRPLASPKSDAVRPTSDKVRGALFNILAHGVDGFELAGAHVLDLFAGTGALGFEALSRGAASCVFVENAAAARALIQENLTAFGFGGAARIFRRDATNLGPSRQAVAFNLVFADPPYGRGLGTRALESAIAGVWLADRALVVLEERAGLEISLPAAVTPFSQRVYGETQIVMGRYEAVPSETRSV